VGIKLSTRITGGDIHRGEVSHARYLDVIGGLDEVGTFNCTRWNETSPISGLPDDGESGGVFYEYDIPLNTTRPRLAGWIKIGIMGNNALEIEQGDNRPRRCRWLSLDRVRAAPRHKSLPPSLLRSSVRQ